MLNAALSALLPLDDDAVRSVLTDPVDLAAGTSLLTPSQLLNLLHTRRGLDVDTLLRRGRSLRAAGGDLAPLDATLLRSLRSLVLPLADDELDGTSLLAAALARSLDTDTLDNTDDLQLRLQQLLKQRDLQNLLHRRNDDLKLRRLLGLLGVDTRNAGGLVRALELLSDSGLPRTAVLADTHLHLGTERLLPDTLRLLGDALRLLPLPLPLPQQNLATTDLVLKQLLQLQRGLLAADAPAVRLDGADLLQLAVDGTAKRTRDLLALCKLLRLNSADVTADDLLTLRGLLQTADAVQLDVSLLRDTDLLHLNALLDVATLLHLDVGAALPGDACTQLLRLLLTVRRLLTLDTATLTMPELLLAVDGTRQLLLLDGSQRLAQHVHMLLLRGHRLLPDAHKLRRTDVALLTLLLQLKDVLQVDGVSADELLDVVNLMKVAVVLRSGAVDDSAAALTVQDLQTLLHLARRSNALLLDGRVLLPLEVDGLALTLADLLQSGTVSTADKLAALNTLLLLPTRSGDEPLRLDLLHATQPSPSVALLQQAGLTTLELRRVDALQPRTGAVLLLCHRLLSALDLSLLSTKLSALYLHLTLDMQRVLSDLRLSRDGSKLSLDAADVTRKAQQLLGRLVDAVRFGLVPRTLQTDKLLLLTAQTAGDLLLDDAHRDHLNAAGALDAVLLKVTTRRLLLLTGTGLPLDDDGVCHAGTTVDVLALDDGTLADGNLGVRDGVALADVGVQELTQLAHAVLRLREVQARQAAADVRVAVDAVLELRRALDEVTVRR